MSEKSLPHIRITQKHIRAALALISTVPEGRILVEAVNKAGITFETDRRFTFERAAYRDNTSTITVPARTAFINLVEMLVHEMRHAWQNKYLPWKKLYALKAEDVLVLARLHEGDAYAYGNLVMRHFVGRIDGAKMTFGVTPENDGSLLKETFARFQSSEEAKLYDEEYIRWMAKNKDSLGKKNLAQAFNKASAKNSAALEDGRYFYVGMEDLEKAAAIVRQAIPDETKRQLKRLGLT